MILTFGSQNVSVLSSHHLTSLYEIWKLQDETTPVIVSEPKCWQRSVVTLTFDPKMHKYLPLTILHLCMKYKSCMLKSAQAINIRTKVLIKFSNCCDLDLWQFDPKIYRFLSLSILHLWMTYESCLLRTIQVIVSEPKVLTNSGVTLTFGSQDVSVSSSRHPAYLYEIWKLYGENYSGYCVRTKVLTNFSCDFDL